MDSVDGVRVPRLADGMHVRGEKKERFKGLGLEQLVGWYHHPW